MTQHMTNFMQNIQDSAYNAWRVKENKDEPQRHTEKLKREQVYSYLLFNEDERENDMERKEDDYDPNYIAELLQAMQQEYQDPSNARKAYEVPDNFIDEDIKRKGMNNCGYNMVTEISIDSILLSTNFQSDDSSNLPLDTNTTNTLTRQNPFVLPPSMQDITSILLTKITCKTRTFQQITNKKQQK